MEHIAAVLLLVSCSSNLADCREIPAPTPIYESLEECREELPFTLADLSGRAPRVLGACVDVDPALEEEDAELVWDVKSGGTLVAHVETSNFAVAADSDRSAGDEN